MMRSLLVRTCARTLARLCFVARQAGEASEFMQRFYARATRRLVCLRAGLFVSSRALATPWNTGADFRYTQG